MTFPIHLQKQIPVKKFEIYLPKFLQNKKILATVLPKPKIPDIFFTIFLQNKIFRLHIYRSSFNLQKKFQIQNSGYNITKNPNLLHKPEVL